MNAAAVAAKVGVELVVGGVQSALLHSLLQNVQPLLPLAAAYKFAYAGNQKVGCGDRLVVVVEAHIERLNLLGIVGE